MINTLKTIILPIMLLFIIISIFISMFLCYTAGKVKAQEEINKLLIKEAIIVEDTEEE